jgi:hypothetical protein
MGYFSYNLKQALRQGAVRLLLALLLLFTILVLWVSIANLKYDDLMQGDAPMSFSGVLLAFGMVAAVTLIALSTAPRRKRGGDGSLRSSVAFTACCCAGLFCVFGAIGMTEGAAKCPAAGGLVVVSLATAWGGFLVPFLAAKWTSGRVTLAWICLAVAVCLGSFGLRRLADCHKALLYQERPELAPAVEAGR